MRAPSGWFVGLALAAALAGLSCGGGRDGPTSPGGPTVDGVESLSFALLNEARVDEGLQPLGFEPDLARAARAHSEAMRDQGFFGHVDPAGRGLSQRIDAVGVAFSVAAENLAQVSHPADPASLAHRELMRSLEHRVNILEPAFSLAGVGAARRGDTWWITQIFVAP